MPDGYTIYHQMCLNMGRTPPTREWWNSTSKTTRVLPHCTQPRLSDAQFDGDTERREGWAND